MKKLQWLHKCMQPHTHTQPTAVENKKKIQKTTTAAAELPETVHKCQNQPSKIESNENILARNDSPANRVATTCDHYHVIPCHVETQLTKYI